MTPVKTVLLRLGKEGFHLCFLPAMLFKLYFNLKFFSLDQICNEAFVKFYSTKADFYHIKSLPKQYNLDCTHLSYSGFHHHIQPWKLNHLRKFINKLHHDYRHESHSCSDRHCFRVFYIMLENRRDILNLRLPFKHLHIPTDQVKEEYHTLLWYCPYCINMRVYLQKRDNCRRIDCMKPH